MNELMVFLSHDAALQVYTGLGTSWANEVFWYELGPRAGSIAQPLDLQSSVLQVPPNITINDQL